MNVWNDFNSAGDGSPFDSIPKNTLVKVRLTLRPGGYDDPQQGWTGGMATQNATTGSVYLNAEYVVLEGPYAKRKVWDLIGLHSPKGPEWAGMGRALIKALLNSARGFAPNDTSPEAQQARRIERLADLDGLVCVIKVGVELGHHGEEKNTVQTIITPEHEQYAAVMGTVHSGGSAPVVPAARPPWAS